MKKGINVPSKIRTYRVEFKGEKNKRTGTFIQEMRVDTLWHNLQTDTSKHMDMDTHMHGHTLHTGTIICTVTPIQCKLTTHNYTHFLYVWALSLYKSPSPISRVDLSPKSQLKKKKDDFLCWSSQKIRQAESGVLSHITKVSLLENQNWVKVTPDVWGTFWENRSCVLIFCDPRLRYGMKKAK